MESLIQVRQNSYYDSVTLMTLSNKLKKIDGILDAVVAMGTDMNKDQLCSVGLSNDDTNLATSKDLIVAIRGENKEICEEVFATIDDLLKNKSAKKGSKEETYPTITAAKSENPDFNFAVISVAGEYAAREAKIAIENDMNVMLFSDNISEEQELSLKQTAHEKGLLVMGPDCGTAIIDGVGLCFANSVKKGGIGLVAASGTGLQEVLVLVDKLGGGISQAIGTGGRDLSAKIGGIMMLDGLKLLEADEDTNVIVLISKPPVKEVAVKILEQVKLCKKPIVVCFIEGEEKLLENTNAVYAKNLEHAATQAVRLYNQSNPERFKKTRFELPTEKIKNAISMLKNEQKYIRGLFCGGTLAAETVSCLAEEVDEYYSNVAKKKEHKMLDPMKSISHTIVDLGDDVFTVGRPHPMIEPELRIERLIEEGNDPETAVIFLDFELGFGSHSDPVGTTVDAIKHIKNTRPEVAIVAYVLGTQNDFQGFSQQVKMLEDLDVIVSNSNYHGSQIALSIALRK